MPTGVYKKNTRSSTSWVLLVLDHSGHSGVTRVLRKISAPVQGLVSASTRTKALAPKHPAWTINSSPQSSMTPAMLPANVENQVSSCQ